MHKNPIVNDPKMHLYNEWNICSNKIYNNKTNPSNIVMVFSYSPSLMENDRDRMFEPISYLLNALHMKKGTQKATHWQASESERVATIYCSLNPFHANIVQLVCWSPLLSGNGFYLSVQLIHIQFRCPDGVLAASETILQSAHVF